MLAMTTTTRVVAVRLAVAATLMGTGGVAGAAQTYWDRGGNTDDLFLGSNWTLNNSHPVQTDEAIIDDAHGGATYATPGVRYFGSTGGGQKFGQLTFDSPTLTTLYAYSTNITSTDPVTLWATPGSNTVLSVGANAGVAGSPQTITITDNPGVNGALYLALNFTPVAANDPAVINVTNADATLKIASFIRNDTTNGANVHGIEKTGDGTLVLAFNNQATNGFGGANQVVKVSGGTLSYSADNNLGSASNHVVLNGGRLQFNTTTATGTVATSRTFDVSGATPSAIDVTVNGNFLYQINGPVTGSGALVKTGTSELTFNNAAGSYSGTLTVNQGSFRLVNPGSVAGATVALNATNATLDLRNDGGGTYNVNVDASTKNAQVYVDHQGSAAGGLFKIGDVKLGAVTLNLNGNAANSNSLQVSDVTLAGNGTIQASAIPVTVGGAISEADGSRSLRKMGAATLTLTQASSFTGGVTVGGGTLEVGADAQLGAAGTNGLAPVTVATDYTPTTFSAAVLRVTGSYATNRPVIAGDGTIENAQDVTMGAVTGSGLLVKSGAGKLTVPSIVGGGLSVGEGTLELAAGGGTSKLASFGYGLGKLDVTNNQVVFGGTTASTVRGWLQSGGIVSATAQGDGTGTTGVGYLTVGSAELDVATWGGLDVSAGDVVTKLTYTGDINLDGKVNADDLTLMDKGLGRYSTGAIAPSGALWADGDVNYDGVVDSADFFLTDKAYARNGGVLSPEFLAERDSQFGDAYVSELTAAVPEPAVGGLVAAAGAVLSLGGRRRRRVR